MNLWILNVQLESIQAPIQLIFNDAERAAVAHRALSAAIEAVRGNASLAPNAVSITDDYGRSLTADPFSLASTLLSDYAQELNARAEIKLLELHAEVDFSKRASSDEKLSRHGQLVRANMAQQPGPLPFMPGRN